MNQRRESELSFLLDAVYSKTGYDFSKYALKSIKRRLLRLALLEGMSGIDMLAERLSFDDSLDAKLLNSIAVPTTSMFRDSETFRQIRSEILPQMHDSPLRCWSAGCSTGEESYSLAILLQEQRLYEQCRIYATDFNENALNKARAGVYSSRAMQKYTVAYLDAGGQFDFSNYYSAAYGFAAFHQNIKERITFAHHNLTTDASFNQFDLILCRNVLIYFAQDLQEEVLKLLDNSLNSEGFLVLGNKETLSLSKLNRRYSRLGPGHGLYQKN